MSKLDCPDDFLKENRPFMAIKKRLRTDGPFIHPTDLSSEGPSKEVSQKMWSGIRKDQMEGNHMPRRMQVVGDIQG